MRKTYMNRKGWHLHDYHTQKVLLISVQKKIRRMFYYTLVIGVLIAICEASKFPAIYLVMDGLLSNSISGDRILGGI